jgi:hypothetical protein
MKAKASDPPNTTDARMHHWGRRRRREEMRGNAASERKEMKQLIWTKVAGFFLKC